MPVKRIQTSSEMLNRVQDSLIPPINLILGHPLLDGRLIETELGLNGHEVPLVLTTTPKDVAHKLGRAYRGWFIIDRNADARIWVDPAVAGVDPNVDPTKFLRLDASATVTVRLWVF